MRLGFLKGYSLLNITDIFLDNKMKDGKPLDPYDINFY